MQELLVAADDVANLRYTAYTADESGPFLPIYTEQPDPGSEVVLPVSTPLAVPRAPRRTATPTLDGSSTGTTIRPAPMQEEGRLTMMDQFSVCSWWLVAGV